jgi:DNA repair and recombination protein RAD54B
MVDFVNPGILGTYQDFKANYEDRIVLDKGASGQAAFNMLRNQCSPFILRRDNKEIQKYLPEKRKNRLLL